MKKTLILSILVTGYLSISGQVGINTESPSVTLEIQEKKGSTDRDGIIVPRLTRAELTAKGDSLYGSAQDGTIIYITDVSGGDKLSQRVNVNSTGYYYYDKNANVWQNLSVGLQNGSPGKKTVLVPDGTALQAINTIGQSEKTAKSGTFTSTKGGILLFTGNGALSVTIGGVTVGYYLYIDGINKGNITQYFDTAQKILFYYNFTVTDIPVGNHTWELRFGGNTSAENYSFVNFNHRMGFHLTEIY